MRVAPQIVISESDRRTLEHTCRRHKASADEKTRARIILLAAEGMQNTAISKQTKASRVTVKKHARWVMDSFFKNGFIWWSLG